MNLSCENFYHNRCKIKKSKLNNNQSTMGQIKYFISKGTSAFSGSIEPGRDIMPVRILAKIYENREKTPIK